MVSKAEKEKKLQQKGVAIWLTGLSGAGKSTLAEALELKLFENGFYTRLLDGDALRTTINKGLGFSDADRLENISRAAAVAKLFVENGIITICSFITPLEKMRQLAKEIIGTAHYFEVYVECSLQKCEERDVKGLYKKARNGEMHNFTGISSQFDVPANPALVINTELNGIEDCVDAIYTQIREKILL